MGNGCQLSAVSFQLKDFTAEIAEERREVGGRAKLYGNPEMHVFAES